MVDNFDPFYNPIVKRRNIETYLANQNFKLVEVDISDQEKLRKRLSGYFNVMVHLAAKASFGSCLFYAVELRGYTFCKHLSGVSDILGSF